MRRSPALVPDVERIDAARLAAERLHEHMRELEVDFEVRAAAQRAEHYFLSAGAVISELPRP